MALIFFSVLILIGLFMMYVFSRTYHLRLERKRGRVEGELHTRLLGLITVKRVKLRNIEKAVAEYLPRRNGSHSHRIVLFADGKQVPFNTIATNTSGQSKRADRITEFVNEPGMPSQTATFSQNIFMGYLLFGAFSVPFFWMGYSGITTYAFKDDFEPPPWVARSQPKETAPSSKVNTDNDVSFYNEKDGPLVFPENFPADAIRPDFCTLTEMTLDHKRGKYDLFGQMNLPVMQAGNRIHAFMRNTQWEPAGVIKQSDAASLSYTKGGIDLSYTFLVNTNEPNTCVINWQPAGINARNE